MNIKYIDELDISRKRVFIRVDFNVPLKDGKILNDVRIRETLPTILYAKEKGARIILASHLGRPKGKVSPEFSLESVAERLWFHLKEKVVFSEDCEANGNKKIVHDMKEGEVFLLENLRFHPGEESNSEHFALQLSNLCDVYINDAFGSVHRPHASVCALPRMKSLKGAGFLIKKEISALKRLLEKPQKPYTVIVGGAKISDKIDLITHLLTVADTIIIGGAMAYTFLKAMGKKVGDSLVDTEKMGGAKDFLKQAETSRVRVLLPVDHVIGRALKDDTPVEVTTGDEIPEAWMGGDIGPKTIKLYGGAIAESHTIMWNGPMGAFEYRPFVEGTKQIAHMMANHKGYTVVGGGDSVSAIYEFKLQYKFSHVSTGGGASLEFLEGRTLPGLEALKC